MSHLSGSNPPAYSEEEEQRVPPPPYDPVLYSQPSLSNIQIQASVYQHPPRTVATPARIVGVPSRSHLNYPTNNFHHMRMEQPVQFEEGGLTWIPALSGTALNLSGKAVIGGHEIDGSPLWVIRAKHKGCMVPGKYSVKNRTASIPFGKKEVIVQRIEVLCSRPENFLWVSAVKGITPPNAVKCGKTKLGVILYVGRTIFQHTLIPGKVQAGDKCYIGFGGSVVSVQTYEVLCAYK